MPSTASMPFWSSHLFRFFPHHFHRFLFAYMCMRLCVAVHYLDTHFWSNYFLMNRNRERKEKKFLFFLFSLSSFYFPATVVWLRATHKHCSIVCQVQIMFQHWQNWSITWRFRIMVIRISMVAPIELLNFDLHTLECSQRKIIPWKFVEHWRQQLKMVFPCCKKHRRKIRFAKHHRI